MNAVSATSRHEIACPKPWTKPRIKVYDMNRLCGEYYYKPMLDYIENKDCTSVEKHLPVHLATLLSREPVNLPSGMELSQGKIEDLHQGPPRMEDFLTKYIARQIKERNSQTVHAKNLLMRQSKSLDTIRDKRTSTLIRNQYINEVSCMYKGKTLERY